MAVTEGFVDAMLAAPVGVSLLAALERRLRRGMGFGVASHSEPDAVHAAAESVASMSFGELVDLAVTVGVIEVGPWIPNAAANAALAYRYAEERAPIAEAIAAHFGEALHAPLNREAQEWWVAAWPDDRPITPLFEHYEQVYDDGQFTWAGLWTVTSPPPVTHAGLLDAWEVHPAPFTRWHVPALPAARVFEIHRPADWARLVTEHPHDAAPLLDSWALPDFADLPSDLSEILTARGQPSRRAYEWRPLVPDWRSVAKTYDGVHLSWAGFITAEGCIAESSAGYVTMLRYWFSERTHWLSDVFGEPEPAGGLSLPHDTSSDGRFASIDVRVDSQRRDKDAAVLGRLLGR